MSSSLPKLEDYAFIYFVCEGTNEEYIIHWMHESRALKLRDSQYSLKFCRCRTPKGRQRLSQEIKELDYGGPVAVAYICDSEKEKWKLPKREIGQEIPVIHIVTKQEIEVLLLLSDPKLFKEWDSKKKSTEKASAFARKHFSCDVKDDKIFKRVFKTFDQFVQACLDYKRISGNNAGCFCLYDLLNNHYKQS